MARRSDSAHPRLGIDQPMWVGEFDIADPPDTLRASDRSPSGHPYTVGRLLVRFHGEPIGMLNAESIDGDVDVPDVMARAQQRFRSQIDGVGPDSSEYSRPGVSVVIGTRNRPTQVLACVRRVLEQCYPAQFEVIVVDNGASDASTAETVADAFGHDQRVRYLAVTQPGLSRARNIGATTAQHPVTAFLSDDILVDPRWLDALARGFARDDRVRCVTGICPPMYLDTPEQIYFESSMAWGTRQGFAPRVYRFDLPSDPVHPYRPGSFANGSNMAYDTEAFLAMGGFDEALGPGTRARGGEDLDAPIRLLANGHLVAFEPAAIGWHADRYDDRSYGRIMYSYGLGLTAFLAKHLIERSSRRSVISRIPKGVPLLLSTSARPRDDLSEHITVPIRFRLYHLAGRLLGPFAYLRSRRSIRRRQGSESGRGRTDHDQALSRA